MCIRDRGGTDTPDRGTLNTDSNGAVGTVPAANSALSRVAVGGATSSLVVVVSLDGSLAAVASISPFSSVSTIRPVAACAKLIYGSLGIL